MPSVWTPRTWEEVCRRASGRRYYNAIRQYQAERRRSEVTRLWLELRWERGWQTRAAALLGVHRSTISRDVRALYARMNAGAPCPCCGTVVPRHQLGSPNGR